MYKYYLTRNGNILNTEIGCFQTVDGRYLRHVLQNELIYLSNLLYPVEFPEGLNNPDISLIDKLTLNMDEFESAFRLINKTSTYESLVDSDLIFKRSYVHRDLLLFIQFSKPGEFVISIYRVIYVNLKGIFFYISGGHVYSLNDPSKPISIVKLVNKR